jgi:hypothetical protein
VAVIGLIELASIVIPIGTVQALDMSESFSATTLPPEVTMSKYFRRCENAGPPVP